MELLRREMDLAVVLKEAEDSSSEPSVPVAESFRTQKERSIVLLELLLLAHSDGELHQKEERVLHSIADELDVSREELGIMQNWALRQVALVQEASEFWTDESATAAF